MNHSEQNVIQERFQVHTAVLKKGQVFWMLHHLLG